MCIRDRTYSVQWASRDRYVRSKVETQHRSRRARASQVRQSYDADAAAELSESDDEPAPLAVVVDDEPLIRQLVSTVLRRKGWTVIEAADGSMALSVVGAGPVDLLVTDYEMPFISGLRLAEQMRAVSYTHLRAHETVLD